MINDKGLIVGLYFADATTSRHECLQISLKKGTKKLQTCIPLKNMDFHLQYGKAIKAIADFMEYPDPLAVAKMCDTEWNFLDHYGLTTREVRLEIVVKKNK